LIATRNSRLSHRFEEMKTTENDADVLACSLPCSTPRKETTELADYTARSMSLIPSGRDQFARKLQRLKKGYVNDNKNHQVEDDDDDDDNVSYSTATKAQECPVEESSEETPTSKATIPKIPESIIIGVIGSYVNDRRVWNCLASLNRETHAISKTLTGLYRPWPSVRWRATTTPRGHPQKRQRRRRIARGAVQTSARPRTVAFGSGYLSYGTDRGEVLVRTLHGDGSIACLRGHSERVNSVRCCGDWLVSAGDDGTTRIWNVNAGSCEAVLEGHSCSITSIAILSVNRCRTSDKERLGDRNSLFSSSEILVATAGMDGNIHLFEVSCEGCRVVSTEHLVVFVDEFHPKPIHSIVMYEKDGRRSLVSGDLDGWLRLWDIDGAVSGLQKDVGDEGIPAPPAKIHSNTCIHRCDGEIKSIRISRDKERIAAAFGRTICHSTLSGATPRSYDPRRYQDHNQRQHQRRRQQQRRLGQQQRRFANDSEGDEPGGDTESDRWRVLKGHSGDIRCIDFSPDGKTIASACSDGSIRLWEIGEGTWKRKWRAHNGFMVCSLDVSSDGQSLLSAGSDGTLAIEDLFPW